MKIAVTKIWPIKGWLGKVLTYIENPDKTENPAFYDSGLLTDRQIGSLSDVIDYSMETGGKRALAGVIDYATDSSKTEQHHYVSGINCSELTARTEMLAVKDQYGKKDGFIAFHAYQSFADGEGTPEQIHEIGLKLANELWGDRFQVVVATHLDKQNHLHNHFVINSVSFVDGKRYYDNTHSYMKLRTVSDRLCLEHGFSVVVNPQHGKAKHYSEWQAESMGITTWRSLIKQDVDASLAASMTVKGLFSNLEKKGYEIKLGKDISVRPPGKQRFFRLARNLGDDYTVAGLSRRLLEQKHPLVPSDEPTKFTRHRVKGKFPKRKITGPRALYYKYLYLLGVLPKNRPKKNMHFLYREDVRETGRLEKQARFLHENKIDTIEQLKSYQGKKAVKLAVLTEHRAELRKLSRRVDSTPDIKDSISDTSAQIVELKKDIALCDAIEERSKGMITKIKAVNQEIHKERKELVKDELRR